MYTETIYFFHFDKQEEQQPCAAQFEAGSMSQLQAQLSSLVATAKLKLRGQGFKESAIKITPFLHMRYFGTGTGLMVEASINSKTNVCELNESSLRRKYETSYEREYGFVMQRPIIVDDVR